MSMQSVLNCLLVKQQFVLNCQMVISMGQQSGSLSTIDQPQEPERHGLPVYRGRAPCTEGFVLFPDLTSAKPSALGSENANFKPKRRSPSRAQVSLA